MSSLTLYTNIIRPDHTETIVFLPGFTGSHDMWNGDFRSLSERYTLVFIDMLGFGNSPKPNIDYSLDDHLEAIENTLQSLHRKAIHMVGYSMGSLLALAYAQRYPENIATLVLLALPYYRNEQEARERIKKSSLFNRWLAMDSPLAHVACEIMCFLRPALRFVVPVFARDVPAVVARSALQHTWLSYSRTLQHVIFRSRVGEWLRGVTYPVLMIHGKYDRIAPFDHVLQVRDDHPLIRLTALEAGHRLVFTHSATIATAIAEFLRDNQRAGI
jgi:pimeloyl-ACP methyl ester carboxylesterase